jgi:adenosylcobinamide-phosphate synthase
MSGLLAPLALLIERRTGYPQPLTDAIGHPVIWFGRLISWLDTNYNRETDASRQRWLAGIFALVALLMAVLVGSVVIVQLTSRIPHGWVIDAILATSLLAQKELGRAVRAVADALDLSLDAGREAVSHIVGRDPKVLDAAGVSRGAIETLAENASDAVIAPLFWLFLFGLPGIALYKAINTADSMIGHLDDRHRDFGWASAKLDDVVNWVPARLTALLIVLAAFLVPDASPSCAAEAARRDAGKHNSPNAGWPEAALAGALGFALGGPRSYEGKVVDLPVMGAGTSDLGSAEIRRALRLYDVMLNITLALSILIGLVLVF